MDGQLKQKSNTKILRRFSSHSGQLRSLGTDIIDTNTLPQLTDVCAKTGLSLLKETDAVTRRHSRTRQTLNRFGWASAPRTCVRPRSGIWSGIWTESVSASSPRRRPESLCGVGWSPAGCWTWTWSETELRPCSWSGRGFGYGRARMVWACGSHMTDTKH